MEITLAAQLNNCHKYIDVNHSFFPCPPESHHRTAVKCIEMTKSS